MIFVKSRFFAYPAGETVRHSTYPLFSIRGQVLKRGINIPCRVRLFVKATGQLFKDVVTDENGYYAFEDIPLNRYYVVAHDPDGEYNAVIQDNIIPK